VAREAVTWGSVSQPPGLEGLPTGTFILSIFEALKLTNIHQ